MPRTAEVGGKPNIKPVTYDGTTSLQDYKSHFDACAMLGKWSKVERGLYLAVSLRGQAQGVLSNLLGDALNDYDELVRALNERLLHRTKLSSIEHSYVNVQRTLLNICQNLDIDKSSIPHSTV